MYSRTATKFNFYVWNSQNILYFKEQTKRWLDYAKYFRITLRMLDLKTNVWKRIYLWLFAGFRFQLVTKPFHLCTYARFKCNLFNLKYLKPRSSDETFYN